MEAKETKFYGIKVKKPIAVKNGCKAYDYCNVYNYYGDVLEKVGSKKITAEEFDKVFEDSIEDYTENFESLTPEEQLEEIIEYFFDIYLCDPEEYVDYIKVVDQVIETVFRSKSDAEKYLKENNLDGEVFEFKTMQGPSSASLS